MPEQQQPVELESFVLRESGHIDLVSDIKERARLRAEEERRAREALLARRLRIDAEQVGKRPKWDLDSDEKKVRWLLAHPVVTRVESKWEMTSVDTSRSWLELYTPNSPVPLILNPGDGIIDYLRLDWFGGVAVKINSTIEGIWRKRVNEIDDFDRKHDRELREYRRLKRKFEGIDDEWRSCEKRSEACI